MPLGRRDETVPFSASFRLDPIAIHIGEPWDLDGIGLVDVDWVYQNQELVTGNDRVFVYVCLSPPENTMIEQSCTLADCCQETASQLVFEKMQTQFFCLHVETGI